MANRSFSPLAGSVKKGVVKLFGAFPTTTGGTLATTGFTSVKKAGFSLTKVAGTGRYGVQLGLGATNPDKYQGLLAVHAVPNGAASAAYTTAKGMHAFPRNVAVSTTGYFEIQFARSDTMADAEVEDAATLYIEITLDNSSV